MSFQSQRFLVSELDLVTRVKKKSDFLVSFLIGLTQNSEQKISGE